jgi:basic amino acid/polyamine antiporter, APA family
MVNIMIGGGIFELPSTVAGILGRESPIACLIASAGVGVIAACTAEVASRFQQAGGPFLYARTAFGRFIGLQTAWLLWLTRIAAAAAVADVFMDYLQDFWPAAKELPIRVVIITILIGGFAAINILGVKAGAQVSNVFVASKMLCLAILVGTGLTFMYRHGTPVPPWTAPHSAGDWMNAILLFVFAYAGFEAALIPTGELKDPRHDIPVALLAALSVITVLYCLIQVVVDATLGSSGHTNLSLMAAADVMGAAKMARAISLGALLSILGFFASNMIATPRITFAMAEQGDFPGVFAVVHRRYHTPYISILAFAILVWLLTLVGTFRWNVALSAGSRLFIYAMVCAALPRLRKNLPSQESLRLHGGLILAFLGVAFCVTLLSQIGLAEVTVLAITALVALLNWLAIRGKLSFRSSL